MDLIKSYIVILLIGAVIGGIIGFALCGLLYSEEEIARASLDTIIDEWCKPAYIAPYDKQFSGFTAGKELPDAQPHFFPDTVRSLAKWIEQNYRVPAPVTLAQYALESSWGRNNLNASNYFGHTFQAVKQYMYHPRFVWAREKAMKNGTMTAGDSVCFARYTNIKECFRTHGMYLSLSLRYSKAFERTSPEGFAQELANAGYATDPLYALKLITIMKRYQLYGS
ncbi:MAG: hypothetical protein EPO24_04055 [Bacteroidetes bacterium]|nr:MAG: hypothetical protein EPO24_04055 [Bacteroidota bacterium]